MPLIFPIRALNKPMIFRNFLTSSAQKSGKVISKALIVLLSLGSTQVALAEDETAEHVDDLSRGKQLYSLCMACHQKDGSGNESVNAPAIAGLQRWYVEAQLRKFSEGHRGTHIDDLPGMQMRPMALTLYVNEHDRKNPKEGLSERNVKNVSAYVATLPGKLPERTTEGGDSEKGKMTYAICMACHGPDAKGNQLLNAPGLTHLQDWYILRQISNFKNGIRGSNPDDIPGMQMKPMAMILADEEAVKDVIAYIQTLSNE
jgi:cytochrome c553